MHSLPTLDTSRFENHSESHFYCWCHFIDFIFFQGFSDLNEDDEQKSEDNSSDSEDAIAVDKNGPKIGDLVNTSS